MKKNAFTLIELLGVIIILAVVLVIAVPQVIKIIDNTKTNAYNQIINEITKASKTYITANAYKIDNFNEVGDSTTISIQNLVEAGLLEKTIVNPKTKKTININSQITVTISASGGYTYTYNIVDQ